MRESCTVPSSHPKHHGPIQLNLRQAGQEASIKAVNVVPTISDLLLPLRIAPFETIQDIIEWDQDLEEAISEISQRLREIFIFVSAEIATGTKICN